VPHPKKTNAYMYRPTSDLIRHIGIEKKEDLPDFAKYQEMKENLENE
jgi:chromosome segregation and condensation protein ScpB